MKDTTKQGLYKAYLEKAEAEERCWNCNVDAPMKPTIEINIFRCRSCNCTFTFFTFEQWDQDVLNTRKRLVQDAMTFIDKKTEVITALRMDLRTLMKMRDRDRARVVQWMQKK